jgi:hypothetical protein
MDKKSLEVQIESIATLEKLYDFFDEAGCDHDYSLKNGELNVSFHGEWLLFYVDKRLMEDQAFLDQAFEDAQMIAEGHWRE